MFRFATGLTLLHGRRTRGQCDDEAGASVVGIAGRYAAVVGDDDRLHEREPKAGPARLRGEERPEHPWGDGGVDARAVVRHTDAQRLLTAIARTLDADAGGNPGIDARLEGVAA